MRTSTFVFAMGTVAISLVLFTVKYQVRDLEEQLETVKSETLRDLKAIHVLEAEWSHLNDPRRLRDLAERHTDMTPVAPGDLAVLETLPLRPPPGMERPEKAIPEPQKRDLDKVWDALEATLAAQTTGGAR